MAEMKFYRCKHCGNLVAVINDGGPTPSCCGEPMELLEANTTEAATEKHVPVVTTDDKHLIVHVGEVDHPMTEEHSIQWIALVNDARIFIKRLNPGDAPEAKFGICCADEADIYAYCNLHGLWKTSFKA